jgi:hypothetical protein
MDISFPLNRIIAEEDMEVYIYDSKTKDLLYAGNPDIADALSSWGKNQIALLLQDASGYPINEVRYRVGGAWGTIAATTSRSDTTLIVTSGTITTTGTYDAFLCANSLDAVNYHNSIAANVVLETNQELVVIVKFGFSGLATDAYGNEMCASLLGNIVDTYHSTLDSFVITSGPDTAPVYTTIVVSKAVSNNTVSASIPAGSEIATPDTYHTWYCKSKNTSTGDTLPFHYFTGATVVLYSGQELGVKHEYIVG